MGIVRREQPHDRQQGHSFWVKHTAVFTAAAVLFTTLITPLAEANFWQDRREAVERMRQNPSDGHSTPNTAPLLAALPHPAPAQSTLYSLPAPQKTSLSAFVSHPGTVSFSPTDKISLAVAGLGDVQDVYRAPNADAPLVVHIQDAHQQIEAQKNIAGMVQSLSEDHATLVGLEGVTGGFNTDPFRRFPDRTLIQNIAEDYLRQGFLGGPEYSAWTGQRAPLLWGVEDQSLYLENIRAFKTALPLQPHLTQQLQDMAASLQLLKERIYSTDLLAFDRRRQAQHKEGKGLGDYVSYMRGLMEKTLAPAAFTREFPQADLFLQTWALEQDLDFPAAEQERLRLVNNLGRALSAHELKDLAEKGSRCRMGRLGQGEFHQHLLSLCRKHGLDTSRLKQIQSYVRYLVMADRLQHAALAREIQDLEDRANVSLIRTEEQREIHQMSQDHERLTQLASFTLTPETWERLQERRQETLTLPERVAKIAAKHSVPARASDPAPWSATLAPFESFFALALRRNDAFVQNLLVKMREDRHKTAVLVTGGFHTEGLMALLRQSKTSYVVVTPKIKNLEADKQYLDIFTRQPLPLEKIFSGETISMTAPFFPSAQAHTEGFNGSNDNLASLVAAEGAVSGSPNGPIPPNLLALLRQMAKADTISIENFPSKRALNKKVSLAKIIFTRGTGQWTAQVAVISKAKAHLLRSYEKCAGAVKGHDNAQAVSYVLLPGRAGSRIYPGVRSRGSQALQQAPTAATVLITLLGSLAPFLVVGASQSPPLAASVAAWVSGLQTVFGLAAAFPVALLMFSRGRSLSWWRTWPRGAKILSMAVWSTALLGIALAWMSPPLFVLLTRFLQINGALLARFFMVNMVFFVGVAVVAAPLAFKPVRALPSRLMSPIFQGFAFKRNKAASAYQGNKLGFRIHLLRWGSGVMSLWLLDFVLGSPLWNNLPGAAASLTAYLYDNPLLGAASFVGLAMAWIFRALLGNGLEGIGRWITLKYLGASLKEIPEFQEDKLLVRWRTYLELPDNRMNKRTLEKIGEIVLSLQRTKRHPILSSAIELAEQTLARLDGRDTPEAEAVRRAIIRLLPQLRRRMRDDSRWKDQSVRASRLLAVHRLVRRPIRLWDNNWVFATLAGLFDEVFAHSAYDPSMIASLPEKPEEKIFSKGDIITALDSVGRDDGEKEKPRLNERVNESLNYAKASSFLLDGVIRNFAKERKDFIRRASNAITGFGLTPLQLEISEKIIRKPLPLTKDDWRTLQDLHLPLEFMNELLTFELNKQRILNMVEGNLGSSWQIETISHIMDIWTVAGYNIVVAGWARLLRLIVSPLMAVVNSIIRIPYAMALCTVWSTQELTRALVPMMASGNRLYPGTYEPAEVIKESRERVKFTPLASPNAKPNTPVGGFWHFLRRMLGRAITLGVVTFGSAFILGAFSGNIVVSVDTFSIQTQTDLSALLVYLRGGIFPIAFHNISIALSKLLEIILNNVRHDMYKNYLRQLDLTAEEHQAGWSSTESAALTSLVADDLASQRELQDPKHDLLFIVVKDQAEKNRVLEALMPLKISKGRGTDEPNPNRRWRNNRTPIILESKFPNGTSLLDSIVKIESFLTAVFQNGLELSEAESKIDEFFAAQTHIKNIDRQPFRNLLLEKLRKGETLRMGDFSLSGLHLGDTSGLDDKSLGEKLDNGLASLHRARRDTKQTLLLDASKLPTRFSHGSFHVTPGDHVTFGVTFLPYNVIKDHRLSIVLTDQARRVINFFSSLWINSADGKPSVEKPYELAFLQEYREGKSNGPQVVDKRLPAGNGLMALDMGHEALRGFLGGAVALMSEYSFLGLGADRDVWTLLVKGLEMKENSVGSVYTHVRAGFDPSDLETVDALSLYENRMQALLKNLALSLGASVNPFHESLISWGPQAPAIPNAAPGPDQDREDGLAGEKIDGHAPVSLDSRRHAAPAQPQVAGASQARVARGISFSRVFASLMTITSAIIPAVIVLVTVASLVLLQPAMGVKAAAPANLPRIGVVDIDDTRLPNNKPLTLMLREKPGINQKIIGELGWRTAFEYLGETEMAMAAPNGKEVPWYRIKVWERDAEGNMVPKIGWSAIKNPNNGAVWVMEIPYPDHFTASHEVAANNASFRSAPSASENTALRRLAKGDQVALASFAPVKKNGIVWVAVMVPNGEQFQFGWVRKSALKPVTAAQPVQEPTGDSRPTIDAGLQDEANLLRDGSSAPLVASPLDNRPVADAGLQDEANLLRDGSSQPLTAEDKRPTDAAGLQDVDGTVLRDGSSEPLTSKDRSAQTSPQSSQDVLSQIENISDEDLKITNILSRWWAAGPGPGIWDGIVSAWNGFWGGSQGRNNVSDTETMPAAAGAMPLALGMMLPVWRSGRNSFNGILGQTRFLLNAAIGLGAQASAGLFLLWNVTGKRIRSVRIWRGSESAKLPAPPFNDYVRYRMLLLWSKGWSALWRLEERITHGDKHVRLTLLGLLGLYVAVRAVFPASHAWEISALVPYLIVTGLLVHTAQGPGWMHETDPLNLQETAFRLVAPFRPTEMRHMPGLRKDERRAQTELLSGIYRRLAKAADAQGLSSIVDQDLWERYRAGMEDQGMRHTIVSLDWTGEKTKDFSLFLLERDEKLNLVMWINPWLVIDPLKLPGVLNHEEISSLLFTTRTHYFFVGQTVNALTDLANNKVGSEATIGYTSPWWVELKHYQQEVVPTIVQEVDRGRLAMFETNYNVSYYRTIYGLPSRDPGNNPALEAFVATLPPVKNGHIEDEIILYIRGGIQTRDQIKGIQNAALRFLLRRPDTPGHTPETFSGSPGLPEQLQSRLLPYFEDGELLNKNEIHVLEALLRHTAFVHGRSGTLNDLDGGEGLQHVQRREMAALAGLALGLSRNPEELQRVLDIYNRTRYIAQQDKKRQSPRGRLKTFKEKIKGIKKPGQAATPEAIVYDLPMRVNADGRVVWDETNPQLQDFQAQLQDDFGTARKDPDKFKKFLAKVVFLRDRAASPREIMTLLEALPNIGEVPETTWRESVWFEKLENGIIEPARLSKTIAEKWARLGRTDKRTPVRMDAFTLYADHWNLSGMDKDQLNLWIFGSDGKLILATESVEIKIDKIRYLKVQA